MVPITDIGDVSNDRFNDLDHDVFQYVFEATLATIRQI